MLLEQKERAKKITLEEVGTNYCADQWENSES